MLYCVIDSFLVLLWKQVLQGRLEAEHPSMTQATQDFRSHISMLGMKQQQYTQQKEAAEQQLQAAGFRPEVPLKLAALTWSTVKNGQFLRMVRDRPSAWLRGRALSICQRSKLPTVGRCNFSFRGCQAVQE